MNPTNLTLDLKKYPTCNYFKDKNISNGNSIPNAGVWVSCPTKGLINTDKTSLGYYTHYGCSDASCSNFPTTLGPIATAAPNASYGIYPWTSSDISNCDPKAIYANNYACRINSDASNCISFDLYQKMLYNTASSLNSIMFSNTDSSANLLIMNPGSSTNTINYKTSTPPISSGSGGLLTDCCSNILTQLAGDSSNSNLIDNISKVSNLYQCKLATGQVSSNNISKVLDANELSLAADPPLSSGLSPQVNPRWNSCEIAFQRLQDGFQADYNGWVGSGDWDDPANRPDWLGKSYNYVSNIFTPEDLNLEVSGDLWKFGNDVAVIADYIDVMIVGPSNANKVPQMPLGNKYFLSTLGTCVPGNYIPATTDASAHWVADMSYCCMKGEGPNCVGTSAGCSVPRAKYINNIPTGNVPLLSSFSGIDFTTVRG